MFWKFWYMEIGEIHTPNVKSPYKAGRLVDLVLLTYGGYGAVLYPLRGCGAHDYRLRFRGAAKDVGLPCPRLG
jgi:hypothetical protein